MAKHQTAQLDFGLLVLDPIEHRRQQQAKGRPCLSCRSMFPSTGPGNRICSGCKQRDAWSAAPAEFSIHAAF
jgi:hypothetical protein